MARKRQIRRRPERKRRSFSAGRSLLLVLICVVLLGFVAAGAYAIQRVKAAEGILPQIETKLREMRTADSIILSSDGKELYRVTPRNQEFRAIEDIPKLVQNATIAAEDHRFFEHQGVDPVAMAAITWEAIFSGGFQRGGSTITMQLAKLYFSKSEETVERKLNDMALAYVMERQFTKSAILQMYLNSVYYGGSAYGVVAAAQVYFGKELDELTPMEAAMVSRSVRRPSSVNPQDNYNATLKAAQDVLLTMKEEGMLTESEYEAASKETPKVRAKQPFAAITGKRSYLVDEAFRALKREAPEIDLSKGGYTVVTSFDSRFQEVVESEVSRAMRRYRGYRVNNCAVVLMDKEGLVLAMSGGADYDRSQYNYATQGGLPTGSSFKPFTYAIAIEDGKLSPYGSINNRTFYIRDRGGRRAIKGGGGGGEIGVARALYTSNNTAAMWVQRLAGTSRVASGSRTIFGIDRDLPLVDTLTLGVADVTPIQMAEAYSVFQNEGTRVEPRMILSITSKAEGEVYSSRKIAYPGRLKRSTARALDAMMRSVVVAPGGTGKAAGSATNARGKTGTTSDNKDAWFCGYTNELIGIVWVGNTSFYKADDGMIKARHNRMAGVMGGQVPAPIWGRIMSRAQQIIGEEFANISTRISTTRDATEGMTSRDDEPADDAPSGGNDESETSPDIEAAPREDRPASDSQSEPAAEPAAPAPDPEPVRPPARPAPERSDDSGGVVTLEICADTRQLASVACPERVTRTFPGGSQPRSSCSRHRLD